MTIKDLIDRLEAIRKVEGDDLPVMVYCKITADSDCATQAVVETDDKMRYCAAGHPFDMYPENFPARKAVCIL